MRALSHSARRHAPVRWSVSGIVRAHKSANHSCRHIAGGNTIAVLLLDRLSTYAPLTGAFRSCIRRKGSSLLPGGLYNLPHQAPYFTLALPRHNIQSHGRREQGNTTWKSHRGDNPRHGKYAAQQDARTSSTMAASATNARQPETHSADPKATHTTAEDTNGSGTKY